MPIEDIKPTESELEGGIPFTPKERLGEVVAEILLKCQEEWKERVLSHLSDEEIQELLKEDDDLFQNPISFAKTAEYELFLRKSLRRAKEVGADIYCCMHDCAKKDCPTNHWDDE